MCDTLKKGDIIGISGVYCRVIVGTVEADPIPHAKEGYFGTIIYIANKERKVDYLIDFVKNDVRFKVKGWDGRRPYPKSVKDAREVYGTLEQLKAYTEKTARVMRIRDK